VCITESDDRDSRSSGRALDEGFRVVSGAITSAVRSGDVIGRTAEHEITVLVPGAPVGTGHDVAARIGAALASTGTDPNGVGFRVAIGVATADPDERLDVDALLARADLALPIASAGRSGSPPTTGSRSTPTTPG
jgi:diguanylate cyclase (GGDEF)-like protein